MKRANLMWCALCLFLGVAVSCSDDDNGDEGNSNYPSASVKATEYGEWTYFDFATGTSRTLPIKGEEGAVTGVYYGKLSGSSIENPDSLQLIITRHTDDSVIISLPEVLMEKMNSDVVDTLSFSAVAKAVKSSDKWTITGDKEVCVVEKSDGTKTNYMVSFNGTIGVTKGSAVELAIFMLPKGMYDMVGESYNLGGNYSAEVDRSYIYAVDGDESSFEWDLAFHKYDIRTNGGSALKTAKTNLDDVNAGNMPMDGFVEDTDGSIYADMSQMMKGFVGIQYVKLNSVLLDWVTRTPTGTMPPTAYTLNKNVFIVKTKSGAYAKVQFYDMTNEKDDKAYPTFNYEYPLK